MNGFTVSFTTGPDIPSSPSPVLIAVIVPFFVLLLVVGIGLFIWRRKKRQEVFLSSSDSSDRRSSNRRSSFGTTSNEWIHGDSTTAGLGKNAASMGSGGEADPDMIERRKPGLIPVGVDPFALGGQGILPLRSTSPASSHVSVGPDLSPRLDRFSQYPDPGTYPAFANPPESSSEGHSSQHGHSSRHGRSSAYHYEASTETIDPPEASLARLGAPINSPPSPTTEQSYHTAFHGGRGTLSPHQRLSTHESIRSTPRKSSIFQLSNFSHMLTFFCRRECPQSVW